MSLTTKKREKLSDARKMRKRNREVTTLLGCMVVLVTAFALMIPAISLTQDLASRESGFYKSDQETQPAQVKPVEGVNMDNYAFEGVSDATVTTEDSGDGASNGDLVATSGDGVLMQEDSDRPETESEHGPDSEVSSETTSSGSEVAGTVKSSSKADMPAQSFKAYLKDADGAVTLTVEVEAPEGAFPVNTYMKLSDVAANDIEDAVGKAVAEKTDGKVTKIQAVDISFHMGGPNGKEIEPACDITVKLTSALIAENEKPLVVHVDDGGEADVVDTLSTRELNKRDLKADDDQILFDADKFSTYGIVITSLEQTLVASDGNAYTITVTCPPEAGIPANADLSVEEITEGSPLFDAYVANTENALGIEQGTAGYIRLFDISIVDSADHSVKHQPAEGAAVDVRIELADSSADNLSVVHFADENDAGSIVNANTSGKIVSFEASGFSIYAVTESTKRLVYEFRNGANILTTEYVKKYEDENGNIVKESLYDPGLVPNYGQKFVGWAEDPAETDPAKIYAIDQLNAQAQAKLDTNYVDGEKTVLYAILEDAYYLRYLYMDEDGTVTVLDTVVVPANGTGAERTVNINKWVDLSEGEIYQGWYDPVEPRTYSPNYSPENNPEYDTVVLDRHLDLYLKVQGRFWLVFDSNAGGAGSGTTYTPPQLLFANNHDTTRMPADPTRKGYTFTGWNTEPDGGGEDWGSQGRDTGKFGAELSKDTILYAQWEPDVAPYHVVFWQQKLNTSGTNPNTDYDYIMTETRNAHTGDSVSITTADTQKVLDASDDNYSIHYVYNESNSDTVQKVVEADGTTTLNVYYDRKEYTLRFFYAREYTVNTPGGYTYSSIGRTNNQGQISGYTGNTGVGTYYADENGNTQLRLQNGVFQYNNIWWRIYANGNVYIRQDAPSGSRTYIQVNDNNEGFLQNQNLSVEQALTYRNNYGDYRRESGTNTWVDVYGSVTNATDLINPAYLTNEEVSTGSIEIQNVGTRIFGNGGGTNYTDTNVDMTYHYIDLTVRYGQSLVDIWPNAKAFQDQTMSNYNYENRGGIVHPLIQGSRSLENNIGGIYSTMDDGLLVSTTDDTGYFLTYWRFQDPLHYLYRVHYSALDGEEGETVSGLPDKYVYKEDKSFVVANGQGWGRTSLTDTGYGYWDVGAVTFDGTDIAKRHDTERTTTSYFNGEAYTGIIDVYYKRHENPIHFITQGTHAQYEDHEIESIPYETSIGKYAEGSTAYYEPDPKTIDDGYFFNGWFADPACTIPYDFTGKTMPDAPITVYAKIDTYRVRVVLVPTTNNAHNDEVEFANNQALYFRMDYNEAISDANINSDVAKRAGYKLIGWYTSPTFEEDTLWEFSTKLNSEIEAVDMDYQSSEDWAQNTYGDNDGAHQNVKGILKLYAKWELDIDENALYVEYEVPDTYVKRDASGNTITTIPYDDKKYMLNEGSGIHITHIGEAPTNYADGFEFKDWVLLNGDGSESSTTSYPGNPLAIDADDLSTYIEERTVTDDNGNTGTIKVITLRGQFEIDDNNQATMVTFDGNGGVTNDTAAKTSVTEALPVNEDFFMKDGDSFVREGYTLLGWAFQRSDGSKISAEDFEDAVTNKTVDQRVQAGIYTLGQKVAADNLKVSDENNWDPLENTVYAVWKANEYTITVKKVVDGDAAPGDEFSFTATANGDYAIHNNDVSFVLADGEGQEFTNKVPYGTDLTFTEAPANGYSIQSVEAVQTSDSAGNPLEEAQYITYSVVDGQPFAVKGDTVITYTNAYKATPIKVVKTDQAGKPLAGATFSGNYIEDTVTTVVTGTGSDAEAVIFEEQAVPLGTYTLHEDAVPAGYNQLAGNITIEVTSNSQTGQIVVSAKVGGEESAFAEANPVDKDDPSQGWLVTIKNDAGVELPSTGGLGTWLIYLIGAALVIAAGAVFIIGRRWSCSA